MKLLLVYCHPREDSFAAAIRDTAIAALTTAGHGVTLADLYAEKFNPVLSAAEHRDYLKAGTNEQTVADDVKRLQSVDGLVFIFPTWWYGLPAMLKGWFDRVWVPHVTFTLPDGPGLIVPALTNIKLIGGITSCGSPWWWMKWVGEPGKRTILRGMRPLCARGCKTFWLTHHRIDVSTAETRARYLQKVEKRLAALPL